MIMMMSSLPYQVFYPSTAYLADKIQYQTNALT